MLISSKKSLCQILCQMKKLDWNGTILQGKVNHKKKCQNFMTF